VREMDSTTVILPGHHGRIDSYGNILLYPDVYRAVRKSATNGAGAARPRAVPRRAPKARKTVRRARR
jgi:hypothetical protein